MIPGELLADRYEIVRELGRNGAGSTCLARDLRTGRSVAAKILHVGLLRDWKSLDLFEREADVLKSLHHPRIPAYIDSFRADLEKDPRFVLVREYVEGTDLQGLVDGGWRGTEEQIRGIGRQLADVVSYIHSLRPPVIHRDITPRNIVARNNGEVFLVDFGGVRDAIRLSETAASTIMGTPGYAPMEQFVGRASVRSDYYGLAATLVFLLTRRSPADLPTKGLKVDVASVIEVGSPGLTRVLDSWLEPDEAARTLSLQDAAALLEREPKPALAPQEPLLSAARPPHGSKIHYWARGAGARYVLPLGAGSGAGRMLSFGTIWLVFIGFWTYAAVRMRAPLGFLFFTIPFLVLGVWMFRRALVSLFGRLELRIDERGLSWSRRFLLPSRPRSVPLAEVGDCRMDRGLFLDAGARTLAIGEGLSHRERVWLRDSINGCLRRLRRHAAPQGSRIPPP